MDRTRIVFLLAGTAVGTLVTLLATGTDVTSRVPEAFSTPVERSLEKPVPMSRQVAEAHRQQQYESISTIEETLALPTDFAQTAALYMLAGRADAAELQDLIYEASRIRERLDRQGALQILFLRLTELDPRSAVAIARSPAFRNESNIERLVWEMWGRLDLDAALTAAAEGAPAEKQLAAAGLYESLRGLSATDAGRIEAALGVAQTRQSKAQQLFVLADQSPAAAFDFIAGIRNPRQRQESYAWLARHLARSIGPDEALKYADMIDNRAGRDTYKGYLSSVVSRRDPEAALVAILSEPMTAERRNAASLAFNYLATQDPDRAVEMFGEVSDSQLRGMLQSTLANRLARDDPQRALAWIEQNATSQKEQLRSMVLSTIAQSDPEAALMAARAFENAQQRTRAANNVIQIVAASDPERAAMLIGMLGDDIQRQPLIQTVASQWAVRDWDASMRWLESLDAPIGDDVYATMASQLVFSDLDAAMRVIGELPAGARESTRTLIAMQLVQQRSLAAAEQFAERYANDAGYQDILVTAISHARPDELEAAMRMAQRLTNRTQRDSALSQLASNQAARDPQAAARALDQIDDDNIRSMTTQQVAGDWYRQDSSAAQSWARSLPRGRGRDMAHIALANMAAESGQDSSGFIRQIADAALRKQAQMQQVYTLAQRDRAAARRLLNDIDMTPEERQQVEQIIDGRY